MLLKKKIMKSFFIIYRRKFRKQTAISRIIQCNGRYLSVCMRVINRVIQAPRKSPPISGSVWNRFCTRRDARMCIMPQRRRVDTHSPIGYRLPFPVAPSKRRMTPAWEECLDYIFSPRITGHTAVSAFVLPVARAFYIYASGTNTVSRHVCHWISSQVPGMTRVRLCARMCTREGRASARKDVEWK